MKLSARQKRQFLRAIVQLQEKVGHFSCNMQEARVSVTEVSARTVCRFLNSEGYYFLQSQKKGVLTVADVHKRLKFGQQMKRESHAELWTTINRQQTTCWKINHAQSWKNCCLRCSFYIHIHGKILSIDFMQQQKFSKVKLVSCSGVISDAVYR